MVAVGDVQRRNALEFLLNELYVRRFYDHPRRVPNAIAGSKVNLRRSGDSTLDQFIQRSAGAIDQKHRSGLGIERLDVPEAIVLFDGASTDAWTGGHVDERGLLAAGTKSKRGFTNFTLHVEFLLPFKPLGRGQDRGNSGVYLQDRYEVQVLDSFGLKGDNSECGAIYSKLKPDVNMCFPPLIWQTYDIEFTAAQFDADGTKTKNAVATVKHNGVTIHDHAEISGPTGGGAPETPQGGPIQLQGHGSPVFYRNIWVVEK